MEMEIIDQKNTFEELLSRRRGLEKSWLAILKKKN